MFMNEGEIKITSATYVHQFRSFTFSKYFQKIMMNHSFSYLTKILTNDLERKMINRKMIYKNHTQHICFLSNENLIKIIIIKYLSYLYIFVLVKFCSRMKIIHNDALLLRWHVRQVIVFINSIGNVTTISLLSQFLTVACPFIVNLYFDQILFFYSILMLIYIIGNKTKFCQSLEISIYLCFKIKAFISTYWSNNVRFI